MKVPDKLRARVTRDLRPVRPHWTPRLRTILLVPVAILFFLASPVLQGIRGDIVDMGTLLAWGGSIAQAVVAVMLIRAALREAVPGQAVPSSSARLLLAAAVACIVVLGVLTRMASPEPSVRSETFLDWFYCWRGAVIVGFPMLIVLLVLIARGLVMRPLLAGALAGMAAGAAVDAGWRLSCNYSNMSHVLPSHGGAVLALAVIGAVGAAVAERISRR